MGRLNCRTLAGSRFSTGNFKTDPHEGTFPSLIFPPLFLPVFGPYNPARGFQMLLLTISRPRNRVHCQEHVANDKTYRVPCNAHIAGNGNLSQTCVTVIACVADK